MKSLTSRTYLNKDRTENTFWQFFSARCVR